MSGRRTLNIACPRCEARPDAPCRTKAGRTTDTHHARSDAWWERSDAQQAAAWAAMYGPPGGQEGEDPRGSGAQRGAQ